MKSEKYATTTALSQLVFIVITLFIIACNNKETNTNAEKQRTLIEKKLNHFLSADSLAPIQRQMEAEGNKIGSVIALREWGRMLRNESRFDEALRVHSEGMHQAEALHDTIEWVRALNNIGTNYRRLGILDAAQEYHYLAWKISEASTDTSFQAKKNRVISLNGMGNIYLTLNNYESADSVFRRALAGEIELRSLYGQAINYANIGSIFKNKGQIDSANIYYRRSMELNKKAKNNIGIAIGHTYFGEINELEGNYDEAYQEYQKALEIMKASKDDWHALNTLLAIAHIDYVTGKEDVALANLTNAEATARKIKSKEHLADIYHLYYLVYQKQGNYQAALQKHLQSTIYRDSVVGAEKMNRIQNVSLNIERRRQMEQMKNAEQQIEKERSRKYTIIGISAFVLLLMFISLAMLNYVQRIRARNYLALKKMNLLRENFFTNITHEFRTPLTVILGLSHDIANNPETDQTTKEKANNIQKQGKNLLQFVNQLLDISKIKSAVGDPDWRKGDISAYIAMIVESYRDYAQSKQIHLQFVSHNHIFTAFVPDYINKIMNNLLSNAFKFTPQYGSVTVTIKQQNNNIQLEVTDTGAGISQAHLPHLFEIFYQAGNNSNTIGSGVGLSLVKQIVDAIEGTITVKSTEGKGTSFLITFPTKEAKASLAQLNDISENTPILPQEKTELKDSPTDNDNLQRILIIEDNTDVAAYIASQLGNNYAIYYAINGVKGLEKAKELVPDLIITDLMMPEMNGLEVCKKVRKNEIISHIPIIVITAKVTEEERVEGFKAGADAYLAKPFNSQELQMLVEKLLEQRQNLRQKYLQWAIESTAETAHKATDETQSDTSATNIVSQEQQRADQQFLAKMVDYIYLMLDKDVEIDVPVMAEKMCMSTRQFYRKINALTGHSPQAYITRVKIHKAKQLLDKNPDMPLKEVAELSGYTDYSSFIRAFKNLEGITPTQYTRKIEE
jgi:DNA-binding response regulator/sensor histidine kinase